MNTFQDPFSPLPHDGGAPAAPIAKGRARGPERRRGERRTGPIPLRDRLTRLRFAAQAAGFGVYDIDCLSGEIHWSPELKAIAGLSPDDTLITYERFAQLLHPDDRERIMAKIAAARDPGGNVEFEDEYRLLRPDGTVRWVRAKGRTFFADDGGKRHPLGATGIVMDITERKHLEETLQQMNGELERRVEERTAELSRANEELVRSNLELQQFGYVAAHDLQTPLRSINGFAQLLQQEFQGRLGDQADVWIGQLVHHVERMHELIQDLLAYSKVNSPGRPYEPTDFNRLFDDIVASFQAALRQSGATVTRDVLPTVPGDRVQLAQVLQNLIGNALKYHGREPPR
ncbi:MAG: hupA2, partial [Rhodocyclaceae bacterium]|nr:hupA2 [Rhodocyclaceae bacterium]